MYIVRQIPRSLWRDKWVNTAISDITEEAAMVAGTCPVSVRWSQLPASDGYAPDALLAFDQQLKHPIRLFSMSVPSTQLKDRQPPKQCTNCYAWHDAQACYQRHQCTQCGTHSADPAHVCLLCCIHCDRPHAADDASCPARPTQRPDGAYSWPTKAALLNIRKAGAHTRQQREAERALAASPRQSQSPCPLNLCHIPDEP